MIDELQRVIVRSIIERYDTSVDIVRAIRDTFPINTLCDMIGINRNRYYYLLRTHELDQTIRTHIIRPVVRGIIDENI
jgi:hypothetical protein